MQLSNSDIHAIQNVRRKIESQLHQHISIKELCDFSKLGETKLTRAFKYCYQVSVFQYHLFVSMEYAKILIEHGTQVKEVAILLGYKRPAHFTRAFLKVFNRPPSEFKADKQQYRCFDMQE